MEGFFLRDGGEKNQDFMLMRFFNPSDLIGSGGDPQPMRFKVCGGGAWRRCAEGCTEGCMEGCAEGVCVGVHGGLPRGGVQRGV